jgi:hypothetical protein
VPTQAAPPCRCIRHQVLTGNALLPHVLEGRGPFDFVLVGANAHGDQLPALLPLVAPHGDRAGWGRGWTGAGTRIGRKMRFAQLGGWGLDAPPLARRECLHCLPTVHCLRHALHPCTGRMLAVVDGMLLAFSRRAGRSPGAFDRAILSRAFSLGGPLRAYTRAELRASVAALRRGAFEGGYGSGAALALEAEKQQAEELRTRLGAADDLVGRGSEELGHLARP